MDLSVVDGVGAFPDREAPGVESDLDAEVADLLEDSSSVHAGAVHWPELGLGDGFPHGRPACSGSGGLRGSFGPCVPLMIAGLLPAPAQQRAG